MNARAVQLQRLDSADGRGRPQRVKSRCSRGARGRGRCEWSRCHVGPVGLAGCGVAIGVGVSPLQVVDEGLVERDAGHVIAISA